MSSIADIVAEMTDEEVLFHLYDWQRWARPKQRLPAGDWTTWLILAGRGYGKSKTGSETIRIWKEEFPILHLVGPTAADVRDIMVEGESGILACSPPTDKPTYSPSTRKLTWKNGSKAILFSADEPDRLRGPQCYAYWADELAAWRYAQEAFDQLQFGLRLGSHPRGIVTTTPRPISIIKDLAKSPTTFLTRGNTYENRSNLAGSFFTQVIAKYEGTRLGRQELEAEILEDVPGALWKMSLIDKCRVTTQPLLLRIVIAVDPAITAKADSDETGIIVAGIDQLGKGYVLDDLSGIYSPQHWALIVIDAYRKWQADRVIAEVNQGGDMVETILRTIDPAVSYRSVHATKGKYTRAEPVAALYEQNKIRHIGSLAKLETQMTTWDPASEVSPDRVDALVWAFTELLLNKKKEFILR